MNPAKRTNAKTAIAGRSQPGAGLAGLDAAWTVAVAGRQYGVPTPVNSVYARVLDDIANMPQLWPKYRERPEALLAEVEAEMRRVKALAKGAAR